MFIGHFALALGAKKYTPQVSLGTLFLACQLADIIWPNLVLLGLEKFSVEPGNTVMMPLDFTHYPWSHSLLALILWSAVFALVYTLLRRAGWRAAILVALLVTSHWVLDALTHRPDLPLTPTGSTRIGLGLWNFPAIAAPLEILIFIAGAWLYVRHTKPRNTRGTIGLWTLLCVLPAIQITTLIDLPPPSPKAVVWTAQGLWLLVAWGYWLDRNRVPA